VLASAEELVESIPRFYRTGTRRTVPEDEYLAAHDLCTAAQGVFLEATRHDLAYNPRFWQLLRKRREASTRSRALVTADHDTAPGSGLVSIAPLL
jgi:hypothetical protein